MADFVTKILDKKSGIYEAAQLIKAGEVLGMPSETVYGLGANAFDEAAVQKVFKLKNRPPDNPLIVHMASVDHCQQLIGRFFSPLELRLVQKFWPGPLSVIFHDDPRLH